MVKPDSYALQKNLLSYSGNIARLTFHPINLTMVNSMKLANAIQLSPEYYEPSGCVPRHKQ
jgi:hypothetical protein